MAEVATIMEMNQSPGVPTSLTNKVARFAAMDGVQPNLVNPCKIPSTSFNYSFVKWWFLRVTGDFNQVRDIYVHGDGNFARDWNLDHDNGGRVRIAHMDSGDSGCPQGNYEVAAGIIGQTGYAIDDPVHGVQYYSGQTIKTLDFDTCTPNAPLLIDSGPYTDDFDSKFWVMDVKIPPTAVYGQKSPKSITAEYNIS
jgi:hypothetical protein